MKIGIALSSFGKSKQLFKQVEGILNDLNIDFKAESPPVGILIK